MNFRLTAGDYAEYIKNIYKLINSKQTYITNLDLATGDGDHWVNINMGFEKLVEKIDELKIMSISDELQNIGKIMMSVIGGSSGVLYGSAYIAAAKAVGNTRYLDKNSLYNVLKAMLGAIMNRGKADVGFKTMIDSLHPAVEEYKLCLDNDIEVCELCDRVKAAAMEGANKTADMEAVKGRATYQSNKGVGHLDPGAVTMSYQISELMDFIKEKII